VCFCEEEGEIKSPWFEKPNINSPNFFMWALLWKSWGFLVTLKPKLKHIMLPLWDGFYLQPACCWVYAGEAPGSEGWGSSTQRLLYHFWYLAFQLILIRFSSPFLILF